MDIRKKCPSFFIIFCFVIFCLIVDGMIDALVHYSTLLVPGYVNMINNIYHYPWPMLQCHPQGALKVVSV